MYKKKKKTSIIIAIVVVAFVMGISFFMNYLKNAKEKANNAEMETEAASFDVLMYKTSDGAVEFDSAWLKSDSDTEAILNIRADVLVSMLVTPKEGKILSSVDIVDYDFNEINSFFRPAEGNAMRVNFVMPSTDIIINFNYEEEETETDTERPAETEMSQTESETEDMPYGLTLHGVTADVITSYNGQFDEREFLQEIGDALHIGSARSEYRDVTDVTISEEPYTGEKDSDKVYYYVYMNQDPLRKVLSIYYMKDKAYVFTEINEPVTEQTQQSETSQSPTGSTYNSATSGTSYGAYGANGSSGGQAITTTTSFDIMQVSTVFLAFTGNEDTFYEKAWEYVLNSGLEGNIVGTMSSYEIDPKNQTAAFKLTLNTGGTVSGTYDRQNNKYSFSGL